MTKKEIIKTICDRANKQKPPLLKGNLTQLATKKIVEWMFESIIDTLVREGRIELRNFGVFEVRQRRPRKARNPRTGARVDVEAKCVVAFQPGKEMEDQVKQNAKLAEPKKKGRKGRAKSDPSTNGTTVPAAAPAGAAAPAHQPVTSDAPAAT